MNGTSIVSDLGPAAAGMVLAFSIALTGYVKVIRPMVKHYQDNLDESNRVQAKTANILTGLDTKLNGHDSKMTEDHNVLKEDHREQRQQTRRRGGD